MNNVQSCIINVQFAKTAEEVTDRFWDSMEWSPIDILYPPLTDDVSTVWTVPRWIKTGDIVFFMCAKTSVDHIRRVKKELLMKMKTLEEKIAKFEDNSNEDEETDVQIAYDVCKLAIRGLIYEEGCVYNKIGGKIFAVGRVDGTLEYIDTGEGQHWSGRVYAPISDIFYLNKPLDISDFRTFITVSREGAITPVFGEKFDKLKVMVRKSTRNVPDYFKDAQAQPTPLTHISRNNYIKIGKEYRRSFFLEEQYRAYYTDYLLTDLCDNDTIYKECRCIKPGVEDSFVDNIIKIDGRRLPVEIKLDINMERDIKKQVEKYCYVKEMYSDRKKELKIDMDSVIKSCVLIIDTNSVFLYTSGNKNIEKVCDIDSINSREDVKQLRRLIGDKIKHYK